MTVEGGEKRTWCTVSKVVAEFERHLLKAGLRQSQPSTEEPAVGERPVAEAVGDRPTPIALDRTNDVGMMEHDGVHAEIDQLHREPAVPGCGYRSNS